MKEKARQEIATEVEMSGKQNENVFVFHSFSLFTVIIYA